MFSVIAPVDVAGKVPHLCRRHELGACSFSGGAGIATFDMVNAA
ncbi:hypothetical protein [Ventosimonas gracilis]|nr:hypothetical protein [Ventosimonas gracilis]